MKSDALLKEYLAKCHVLQLATSENDQPYVCSVYYVHDSSLNIYWASWPERRHSQRIMQNNQVAATIVVESDKTKPVCGIQITGRAELCDDPVQISPIAKNYAEKFGRDSDWIEAFSQLNTKHRLYKLTPSTIELFDEVNFPSDPQQKILS